MQNSEGAFLVLRVGKTREGRELSLWDPAKKKFRTEEARGELPEERP